MTERRSADSGRTHSQVCAGGCDSYVDKALSPVQRANASSTRGSHLTYGGSVPFFSLTLGRNTASRAKRPDDHRNAAAGVEHEHIIPVGRTASHGGCGTHSSDTGHTGGLHCSRVVVQLLDKGFAVAGFRKRRHRVAVNLLVVAKPKQRAMPLIYAQSTGGYATYGGHGTRANGTKGLCGPPSLPPSCSAAGAAGSVQRRPPNAWEPVEPRILLGEQCLRTYERELRYTCRWGYSADTVGM